MRRERSLILRLDKEVCTPRIERKKNGKRLAVALSFDDGRPIDLRVPSARFGSASQHQTAESLGFASFLTKDDSLEYAIEEFESDAGEMVDAEHAEDGTGSQAEVKADVDHSPASPVPSIPVEAAIEPATDDEVDADLQAILAEAMEAAQPQKKTPAPPPAFSQPEHDVFDQIGRSLAFANTFDLGPVNLEERFAEIEREIDAQEQKVATGELADDESPIGLNGAAEKEGVVTFARSTDVDAVDLAEDLSWIDLEHELKEQASARHTATSPSVDPLDERGVAPESSEPGHDHFEDGDVAEARFEDVVADRSDADEPEGAIEAESSDAESEADEVVHHDVGEPASSELHEPLT